MTERKQNTFLYVVIACLAPLTVWLHEKVDLSVDRLKSKMHQRYVPSAQAVRLVGLGYDRLLADFYWLAFINYIGDEPARIADHSVNADKYLDLITGLDPKFVQPYWFCAFTVGADQRRPLRANEIIQRGISANQNNWYLPYIAGVNLYLFAHDEAEAARFYHAASKFPDAPKWLGRQAEFLAARIPSTTKEIITWDSIYRSEPNSIIRSKARQKLIQLLSQVYSKSLDRKQRKLAQLKIDQLRESIAPIP